MCPVRKIPNLIGVVFFYKFPNEELSSSMEHATLETKNCKGAAKFHVES